ncbi:c(7)-type cytochrome triheme domain-containing protein [Desulfurivibrio sp. D14AmB]|uniref:c(7)-type cytochrome triheme domain-containing protein n=1 Tax=Desulfurivibrio sp. D14AmB TaxID=3374370 RepID=UPI00376ED57E
MQREKRKLTRVLGLAVVAGFLLVGLGQAIGGGYYGPEEPIIWSKPVEGVVFEHLPHTRDAGLQCHHCHTDLFEYQAGAAEKQDDFTMEAMYQGKYCGACHNGVVVFAASTRCTTCHIGVKGVRRLTGQD